MHVLKNGTTYKESRPLRVKIKGIISFSGMRITCDRGFGIPVVIMPYDKLILLFKYFTSNNIFVQLGLCHSLPHTTNILKWTA